MKILKWIKRIFTVISVTLMGMAGGQKGITKGVRRFGIPGLATLLGFFSKNKKKAWAFTLLIPILCIGYGENSFLMGIFNSDFIVRIVYGLLISIPFIVFGITKWLFTALSLMIAFSIRAGSLGSIGGFDVLVEDICRYLTLGFWIAYNTIKGD